MYENKNIDIDIIVKEKFQYDINNNIITHKYMASFKVYWHFTSTNS